MPINQPTSPEERLLRGRGARERDPAREQRKRELGGLRSGTTMQSDFLSDRHVPTNRVTGRMLRSGENDEERAITREHVKRQEIMNEHLKDMNGGKLHQKSVSDGKLVEDYSKDDHNHDGRYADDDHDHSEYLTTSEGDARYVRL